MGMAMVTRGRMGFVPHRIRDLAGLRAILACASELEAARLDTEQIEAVDGHGATP
jgi:hypothetical protein